MNCSSEKCMNWGLFLLRVFLGLAFIYHGFGKLFGPMPGMEMFTGMVKSMGFPAPMFFAYVAAIIELVGGIALVVGSHVKHAGYALAVVMLVALFGMTTGFGAHSMAFSFMALELPLAYLVMSLVVAWVGPGSIVLFHCPCPCCKKCDCSKKDCKMCTSGDKK